MGCRQAVEKLVGRMYKQYEKTKGSLPDSKTVRSMEQKALRAAIKVDRKK